MLEGITILNQTPVLEDPWYVIPLGIISFSLLFPFVVLLSIGIAEHNKIIFGISTVITIILLVLLCVAIKTEDTVDTGRYRYEVMIDDSVSFNKVLENYDIIEQNGRIWTIEDKEKEVNNETKRP